MSDPVARLNAAIAMRLPSTKRLPSFRPFLLLLLTAMLIGAAARTAEAQTESRKSPWLAFGLSYLLPGAGQAYNGQWGKGGLMLGGVAVSFGVVLADDCDVFYTANDCGFLTAAGVVGMVGFVLWSWIDAPITANAINRRIDAGQVALEIGPQLIAPNRDSGAGLSLVRVRF